MLRLAFLDSWLQKSDEGSGTAVGIRGLESALRAAGHSVTRFSPASDRVADLTLRRLLFNIKIHTLVNPQDYDMIVGFDFDGFCWNLTQSSVPYVVSIKGVLAEEAQNEDGAARELLSTLAEIEGHNARRASLVIATSQYCKKAIHRDYQVPNDRITIVPEGIDLAWWSQVARREAQKKYPIILCVARQYRRKRIIDLIMAMKDVIKTIPNAQAVIIGDGPEHKHLLWLVDKLNLGKSVSLLGAIPSDEEVAKWYGRASIFCLPSYQEGFGIVFLEAMACGLPIVSTTSCAIPEVVCHDKGGLLVPPSDVAALTATLIHLLRLPSLCESFGSFNREYVKRFDWSEVARIFTEQVLSRFSRR